MSDIQFRSQQFNADQDAKAAASDQQAAQSVERGVMAVGEGIARNQQFQAKLQAEERIKQAQMQLDYDELEVERSKNQFSAREAELKRTEAMARLDLMRQRTDLMVNAKMGAAALRRQELQDELLGEQISNVRSMREDRDRAKRRPGDLTHASALSILKSRDSLLGSGMSEAEVDKVIARARTFLGDGGGEQQPVDPGQPPESYQGAGPAPEPQGPEQGPKTPMTAAWGNPGGSEGQPTAMHHLGNWLARSVDSMPKDTKARGPRHRMLDHFIDITDSGMAVRPERQEEFARFSGLAEQVFAKSRSPEGGVLNPDEFWGALSATLYRTFDGDWKKMTAAMESALQ